ncbi:hypothetical protein F4819DRAFT_504276 [Hypoxylon fuscum]|nr:hypothetical protein F4819DRAFT_504276 [Hypoxylon fuscum]
MAVLFNLPDELLELILLNLTLKFNVRRVGWKRCLRPRDAYDAEVREALISQLNLSNTSKASKRLRRITLPHLYHTIPTTSVNLLHVLAGDAYLASLVKVADLTPLLMPIASLRQALDITLRRLTLPLYFKSGLQGAIEGAESHNDRYHNYGVQVALHMALLPNLEAILYQSNNHLNHIVMNIICVTYGELYSLLKITPGVLSKLRHLFIYHCDPENPEVHSTQSFTFRGLLLPSLELLVGVGISWCQTPNLPPNLSLPHSNSRLEKVTHFMLYKSEISHIDFESMLVCMPNVQHLRITWGKFRCFETNFDTMGDSLRRHGHSLRSLILDPMSCLSWRARSTIGIVGSLRNLEQLQDLTVPQYLLTGNPGLLHFDSDDEMENEPSYLTLQQTLPSSLRSLFLVGCQKDEEAQDNEICEIIQEGGGLTNLRRIQMIRYKPFTREASKYGFRAVFKADGYVATLTKRKRRNASSEATG